MMLFAHAGITLGAATLLAGAVKSRHSSRIKGLSWLTSLGSYIDIRILLVGSLLPDIIDKPVGNFIFRDTFSNGRIFSHTLLFLILVTGAGFYLYKLRRQVWLLTLAFGILMHLILDEMWFAPNTLFWPIFGFTFEKVEITSVIFWWFHGLVSYPDIFIPELAGIAIMLWFGVTLAGRKKIGVFIKYGKVS